jgi:hypothetical protein
MTKWLMVVALLAVTPAHAQMSIVPKTPKSVERAPSAPSSSAYSANEILPYCVSAPETPPSYNYQMQGFCAGILLGLYVSSPHWGACIPPEVVTPSQLMRVAVRYISVRPERMHEPFALLAAESLKEAWPCKPPAD